MPEPPSKPAVLLPVGILAICVLVSFAGLLDHDLWTPDEHREAALTLGMARSGNWVVPALAGEPFVEKPPLYYWGGALFLHVLGPAVGPIGALRLSSAFWGLSALVATGLLARRLFGRGTARLAAAVLATMPGFLYVTHRLLVDNALMAFTAAALWAAAEAYVGRRWAWLPLAGVFAAGAFLCKGAIGPIIVALGACGLLWAQPPSGDPAPWRRPPVWLGHGLAVCCFVGLAGAWMLLFWREVGPDGWREWFWQNHFGRLLGRAERLGHREGPAYYLAALPVYILPWLAPVGLWFARAWRRRGAREPADGLLIAWALGGLLLLSLSVTKRDIYLAVLLPAVALMAADGVRRALDEPGAPAARLVRGSLAVWTGVGLAGLAVLAAAPLAGPRVREWVGGWGPGQAAAALAFGWGLLSLWRRAWPWPARAIGVMALTGLVVLGVLMPRVDRVKSYAPVFLDLGARLQAAPSARVAGWALDETSRGGFYFYCGLAFPRLSAISEVRRVLEGRHPAYNGVLAFSKEPPGAHPADVLPEGVIVRAEGRMGGSRVLRWLEAPLPRGAGR